MPRGDRTGPNGMGPMTGRGAGFCAGYAAPGFMNSGGGFGMGRGAGRRGGGWRHRHIANATGIPGWQRGGPGWPFPAASMPAEQRLEMLKKEAEQVEETLKELQERIAAVEAGVGKERE